MKSKTKLLVTLAVALGAFASYAKATYFLGEVHYGWTAGYVYSVPAGANVEADADGGGSWAHTQVGGGGLGLNLEAGYGQANDWVGNTSYADDIYYNLSAGGDGTATSLLYVGW